MDASIVQRSREEGGTFALDPVGPEPIWHDAFVGPSRGGQQNLPISLPLIHAHGKLDYFNLLLSPPEQLSTHRSVYFQFIQWGVNFNYADWVSEKLHKIVSSDQTRCCHLASDIYAQVRWHCWKVQDLSGQMPVQLAPCKPEICIPHEEQINGRMTPTGPTDNRLLLLKPIIAGITKTL